MDKLRIIRSNKFSQYRQLIFGFSTRDGGVSPDPYNLNLSFNVGDEKLNVIENRKIFFGRLGIGLDELAIPCQIQSGNVGRIYVQGGYDNCDGLVTNSYGVFLTISTADCLPIFLYDPIKKSVGAIHSGWRGCELNIFSNAINLMQKEFNTHPSDLIAYIGPSAGVCCYEVGAEVAGKFDPKFIVEQGEKQFLDLKNISKSQLVQCGVIEKNIEVSAQCTICNRNLYHSYRRDKHKSGRMMGVIGIVR